MQIGIFSPVMLSGCKASYLYQKCALFWKNCLSRSIHCETLVREKRWLGQIDVGSPFVFVSLWIAFNLSFLRTENWGKAKKNISSLCKWGEKIIPFWIVQCFQVSYQTCCKRWRELETHSGGINLLAVSALSTVTNWPL